MEAAPAVRSSTWTCAEARSVVITYCRPGRCSSKRRSPDCRRSKVQGSTQPIKDRTLRNEQRLRFANVVAGIAPELLTRSELIRQLAEDLEFSDAKSFLITEDQQEQQTVMEENRLLLQGIPQIVGPNEPHMLHISGHQQAIQQAGKPVPAMDQHILAHGQQLRAKNPRAGAQVGDEGATRGVAASPEAMRQGSPDMEDMEGALARVLSERGTEQGGVRTMAR